MYNAEVADWVYWYQHASRNNGRVAALVVGTNGNGVLDLIRFTKNNPNGLPVSGVRHISEQQYLDDHYEVKEKMGAWESIADSKELAKKEAAKETARKNLEIARAAKAQQQSV